MLLRLESSGRVTVGFRSMVLVTLGTGVGGGVIHNGRFLPEAEEQGRDRSPAC